MSASIMWEPIKPGRELYVMAPSSFMETMEKVFGKRPPCVFSREDLPKLEAMRDAYEAPGKNPWGQLCSAVEKYEGGIELSVQY